MRKKWILAALMIALSVQPRVLADDIEIETEDWDAQTEEMEDGDFDVEFEEDIFQEVEGEGSVSVSEVTVDAGNFQETVLFENESCALTLTGLEPDYEDGCAWDISFVNKTGGEVMFSFDKASVNGYMIGVSMEEDEDVPGTGAVEDRIVFDRDSLDENQIGEFARAELTLHVMSGEDYLPVVQAAIGVTFAGVEAVQTESDASQPAEGEIVLAQTEDYLIKIKETETNEDGYFWKVYLENVSDRTMQVYMENVTIDGLVCDPYWNNTVASGKKLNDVISWYLYMLEENAISEVTEVEGDLSVVLYTDDYEDYTEESYPFHLYPLGEEAAKPFERTPVEGEYTVLDNEFCKIIVTGREADEYGCYLNVFLENKLDKNVEISMDSSVLNGIPLENSWGVLIVDIPAGKCCNTQAYWGNEDLEWAGISDAEEIETVDVTLNIYESTGSAFQRDGAEIASEELSLVSAG